MRCSEARRELIRHKGRVSDDPGSAELLEHLRDCSECRQFATAERLLADDMKRIRELTPETAITLEQVSEGLRDRKERDMQLSKGRRLVKQTIETIERRPQLSIATAIFVVLVAASAVIPLRMSTPGTYEVAFAALDPSVTLSENGTQAMLAALDIEGADVEKNETESGEEYTISRLRDTADVRKLLYMLEEIGGADVKDVRKSGQHDDRTVWQLVFSDKDVQYDTVAVGPVRNIKLDHFSEQFGEDFTLWIAVDGGDPDSMRGLLMNREGDHTNIQLVGLSSDGDDDSFGWNQWLNGNTSLNTRTPDGLRREFDLTDIKDVRWLEKNGYNFSLMEFDAPGQIPIEGLGPKLESPDPNPFSDKTVIEFWLPQAHEVRIDVIDGSGRMVRTLVNRIILAGIFHTTWDGTDDNGNVLADGTYRCRMFAGHFKATEELTLRR